MQSSQNWGVKFIAQKAYLPEHCYHTNRLQLRYTIEIATQDFVTSKLAVEGGADRIELCAALADGGTTASFGTIKKCREAFNVELFPIIRARSGDFFYTNEEIDLMFDDVKLCRQLGCDGVVIGFLNCSGAIDVKTTSKFIDIAYPMEVTFHRAFDRCREPFQALEQLIEIGCTRILTSGQHPKAIEGLDVIAALIKAANERIIIMPGSGVRKENIKELAQKTGAVEFHASLRNLSGSIMQFKHPLFAESHESYSNPFVDPEDIRTLRYELMH